MIAMTFSESLTDVNSAESYKSIIQLQTLATLLMLISYQTYSNTVDIQTDWYSKAAYKIDAALLLLYCMIFSEEKHHNIMKITNSKNFEQAETVFLLDSDSKWQKIFIRTQKLIIKQDYFMFRTDIFQIWINQFWQSSIQNNEIYIYFADSDHTETLNQQNNHWQVNNESENSHNQNVNAS